jgi:hypothetical protein
MWEVFTTWLTSGSGFQIAMKAFGGAGLAALLIALLYDRGVKRSTPDERAATGGMGPVYAILFLFLIALYLGANVKGW